MPPVGGLANHLRHRLLALSPTARQVLAAAAILGNQFTIARVKRIADVPANLVFDALQELEQFHLIRGIGDDGVYTFIHDKIREVLLSDLSLARRRMLHLRAAHQLQVEDHVGENPNSARIATHLTAGGEPSAAILAWLAAARAFIWIIPAPATRCKRTRCRDP